MHSSKYKKNDKFVFIQKHKFNWKLALQILIITAILTGIETFDYFYIGIWFGQLFTSAHTLNLQMPIDKIMPWCTPLLIIYIPWPFIWMVVIPLFAYFSSGKKSFYSYSLNSLMMYVFSMVIYMVIPTECQPKQFIDGTYNTLPSNALFHDYIVKLADNPENIWGSCPSFHNYWAALFILYGLKKDVKWYFRYPMLVFGIMISLSTLMLHQHNLADIIITYSFTFLFAYLIKKYDLVSKLKIENFTCFK